VSVGSPLKPRKTSDEKEVLTSQEIAELKEFRTELEKVDEEERGKIVVTQDGVLDRQIGQPEDDDYLSENSEEAFDFLNDFYREMNFDLDSS
jgi:hypothetical protein